jgi:hypothetical protein
VLSMHRHPKSPQCTGHRDNRYQRRVVPPVYQSPAYPGPVRLTVPVLVRQVRDTRKLDRFSAKGYPADYRVEEFILDALNK